MIGRRWVTPSSRLKPTVMIIQRHTILTSTMSFFAEHGRCILRGPYAMILQLAAPLLDRVELDRISAQTLEILQHPEDSEDRAWSPKPEWKAAFFHWLPTHR